MCKLYARLALAAFLSLLIFAFNSTANADTVKGIYLTQTTMEDTKYLTYLINQAKAVGINTFVVDLELPSKRYHANVALLKNNHINYVARIEIFPGGGTPAQVESEAYWQKKYKLVQYAIDYGADQVQLDYIRYNTHQKPSAQNAENILKVIGWFKNKVSQQHIPLQIDTFGIASFGESKYIGQNLKLFSQSVDAICPMVYPSHYEPFRIHAVTPYQTVYTSLKSIKAKFAGKLPMRVIAYIEIFNYRYPLSGQQRINYVNAEMRAVRDAGIDGWYVWSAHNEYDFLFKFLKNGGADLAPGKITNPNMPVAAENTKDTHETKEARKPVDVSAAKPTLEFAPPFCSLTDCKSTLWNINTVL